uniref:Uncharacterized protein n=1 Tax=Glossina palpalis gambiensis TaxID=67801 RepID=A0A1B0B0I5_9MUSC
MLKIPQQHGNDGDNKGNFEPLRLHIFYNKRKSISAKCQALATVQTNSLPSSPSTKVTNKVN